MGMHLIDPHSKESITVEHGDEPRQKYDLPEDPEWSGLEKSIERNYNAIDAFKHSEDLVFNTEWDNFSWYLRGKGASQSLIDYLESDPNYIAGDITKKPIVAGTIPQHSTLTYMIPGDYISKIKGFADRYGISEDQVQTIVYLHEAVHNILHNYKTGHRIPEDIKEKEVETFLTDYFTAMADRAQTDGERSHYLSMASVTSKRLGQIESAVAAFSAGEISQEELAAIEMEIAEAYDTEIHEYSKYVGEEDSENIEAEEENEQSANGTDTLEDAVEEASEGDGGEE